MKRNMCDTKSQENLLRDFDALKGTAKRLPLIQFLLRNHKGVGLADVAKKHGINRSTLTHTITGHRRNMQCMIALSRELGIHTSELFPKNGSGKGAK